MAKKLSKPTTRKAASKLDKIPEGRRSSTITDFCLRNGFSKGTFYNMCEAGRGPRLLRPTGKEGGVVLITEEAESDWIKEREARDAAEISADAPKTDAAE